MILGLDTPLIMIIHTHTHTHMYIQTHTHTNLPADDPQTTVYDGKQQEWNISKTIGH